MNNPQKFFLIAIAFLLFSSMSCKKTDKCTAGTGGAVTIVAFPQHHTAPVISESEPGYPDSAFVKFSPPSDFVTTSNPADYDLVVVGDSGEDHVHIPNLKCGDYFIFMTGWDIGIPSRVKGGVPESFTQTSGEIVLDVPVTE
jgi:hypothetical protein